MKHLHSGNPLVPVAHPSARSVEVDVGKKLGLQHWERGSLATEAFSILKWPIASICSDMDTYGFSLLGFKRKFYHYWKGLLLPFAVTWICLCVSPLFWF